MSQTQAMTPVVQQLIFAFPCSNGTFSPACRPTPAPTSPHQPHVLPVPSSWTVAGAVVVALVLLASAMYCLRRCQRRDRTGEAEADDRGSHHAVELMEPVFGQSALSRDATFSGGSLSPVSPTGSTALLPGRGFALAHNHDVDPGADTGTSHALRYAPVGEDPADGL